MAFFKQSRFPRLWLLMQNMIGGLKCKQELATLHYQGEKRVLEIGCSVGTISSAFRAFPDVEFTGIDIDPKAITLAKHRFRAYPNFRFSVDSLEELTRKGKQFDYIIFAAMLHHVSDAEGLLLLSQAVKCTANGGKLVICEPEALNESDGWFLHFFYSKFEQGQFLRFRDHLVRLVKGAGIALTSIEDKMITPARFSRPYSARFNLIVGKPVV